MFLDGSFCSADDHEDLVDAGVQTFFNDILDGGFVDHREHLLGDGFGDREEAGPEARGGDDGFADDHGWLVAWKVSRRVTATHTGHFGRRGQRSEKKSKSLSEKVKVS